MRRNETRQEKRWNNCSLETRRDETRKMMEQLSGLEMRRDETTKTMEQLSG
jgi:hypothetical protein